MKLKGNRWSTDLGRHFLSLVSQLNTSRCQEYLHSNNPDVAQYEAEFQNCIHFKDECRSSSPLCARGGLFWATCQTSQLVPIRSPVPYSPLIWKGLLNIPTSIELSVHPPKGWALDWQVTD